MEDPMCITLETNPEKTKALKLVDQISGICGKNGWDFFCLLATDVNELGTHLVESGNDFIGQSTIQSYTSVELLLKMLPSKLVQSGNTDQALS